MNKREINPTPWLQHFSLNHGIEVSGAQRTLYLSGQTSTDADGATLHPGDLVAQFGKAWSNVKDALAEANMAPTDVVRLNIYTTDVNRFMAEAEAIIPIFAQDGVQTSCTLLGIAGLFEPDLLVELEATAVA
ncbi:MAG: RidA family protein [Sphingomonas sp.]|nr:RidA family protein [Sphingomonas sp.]